jgi:hypothetical protein
MPGRELLLAVPAGIALLLSPSIASGQYDLIERRCAELASSPADPRRAGDGVPIDRIRIQDAPSACIDAPRHQPQSSRTQNLYHYGRVLEANQNFEPARSYYLAAAEAGHPTAAFNPARLWESGSDGPKNAANWRESGYGGYSQGYTGLAAIFVKSTPANHVESGRGGGRVGAQSISGDCEFRQISTGQGPGGAGFRKLFQGHRGHTRGHHRPGRRDCPGGIAQRSEQFFLVRRPGQRQPGR